MPVIKVRENGPFDVALRRFKRSCEKSRCSGGKFVVVSSMKNRLPNVSAPKPLQVKRHAKKLARENARRTRLR